MSSGASTASYVDDASPSPALPASALQLHPDATFILDNAAAARLA